MGRYLTEDMGKFKIRLSLIEDSPSRTRPPLFNPAPPGSLTTGVFGVFPPRWEREAERDTSSKEGGQGGLLEIVWHA